LTLRTAVETHDGTLLGFRAVLLGFRAVLLGLLLLSERGGSLL
jgi:hypothetical protein